MPTLGWQLTRNCRPNRQVRIGGPRAPTYQRSRDLMQDLRKRGILADDDAIEIEKVGHKIAECEAALKAGP